MLRMNRVIKASAYQLSANAASSTHVSSFRSVPSSAVLFARVSSPILSRFVSSATLKRAKKRAPFRAAEEEFAPVIDDAPHGDVDDQQVYDEHTYDDASTASALTPPVTSQSTRTSPPRVQLSAPVQQAWDKVLLSNMVFFGHHGVHLFETKNGQLFAVDLEMEADLSRAGETDELTETIDYSTVHSMVKRIVEGTPRKLVEHVGYRIIENILDRFPKVHSVKVRVRKPQVQLKGELDYAGVELWRQRVYPDSESQSDPMIDDELSLTAPISESEMAELDAEFGTELRNELAVTDEEFTEDDIKLFDVVHAEMERLDAAGELNAVALGKMVKFQVAKELERLGKRDSSQQKQHTQQQPEQEEEIDQETEEPVPQSNSNVKASPTKATPPSASSNSTKSSTPTTPSSKVSSKPSPWWVDSDQSATATASKPAKSNTQIYLEMQRQRERAEEQRKKEKAEQKKNKKSRR